jgi:HSP20 family protein
MTSPIRHNEVEKQEVQIADGIERTRPRKIFAPLADVLETPEEIVVLADMPGVDENNLDITLEKNILSIAALVDPPSFEGYSLAYREYASGDYQRSFTLSDEVDRDKISATVKDGLLKLILPKSKFSKARKITVKAE